MWEAIRSNTRRSWILITLMGMLLIALGGAIGTAVNPRPEVGGAAGALIAAFVWLALWFVAVTQGDHILLAGARAVEIQKDDAPQLWNVVEEMTVAAGLPRMPRIYVIDEGAPNAFAVGKHPDSAAVAVTAGLLRRLTRDELQGVIAHEIGHIRNLDVRFLTLAGVMLGAIVMIADVFLRTLRTIGLGGRRSARGAGAAQAVFLLLAVGMAILAPLVAQILYFACSRRREFLADASSARFTRYPEGLASALEKIASSANSMQDVNRVIAPLYIVNPRESRALVSLFSTHPPTEARIKILRSMGGRAGLVDYESAYRKVQGGWRKCIGSRTLSEDATLQARGPSADATAAEATAKRARDMSDLLSRLANFVVIPCECGVRIKVPPGFQGNSITCTRCGIQHVIPTALPFGAITGQGGPADVPVPRPVATPVARAFPPAPPPVLYYTRKGPAWESFRCRCGHTLQLSPNFAGSHATCPACKADIAITHESGRHA